MQVILEHSFEWVDQKKWDHLVNQNATNTIFQTFAWHVSWWDAFSRDKQLFLVYAQEGEHVRGILPLMLKKKGKLRILKFVGDGHADYCDFIYGQDETMLRRMLDYVFDHKDLWDAMALDHIPEESPSNAVLKSMSQKYKLKCHNYSKLPCPALIIDEHKTEVQKILQKKSIKRHYNYFVKKGDYQVLHLNEFQEINLNLEPFFDQHIKRRAHIRGKSLFSDMDNRIFYKNLVFKLCPQDWLHFTIIKSEGAVIAFHFGFIYNGKFIWYKPSFDPALSKHSPGEVLLKELLEFAADQGAQEFDFTIGDETFKSRFTNTTRINLSYKIFKTNGAYRLDRLMSFFKKA